MEVKIVMLTIVTMYFILTVTAECASPDIWTELFPNENKARSFETPNDLRTHLDSLSNYYAVVGRPRFGKRNTNKDQLMLDNLRSRLPRKYWNRIIRILSEADGE